MDTLPLKVPHEVVLVAVVAPHHWVVVVGSVLVHVFLAAPYSSSLLFMRSFLLNFKSICSYMISNGIIALFRVLSSVLSNASVGLINLVYILWTILFVALLEREKMIE